MNIILTHENGDFDSLAAVVAVSRLYRDSLVILPETLQPNVRSFVNLYRDLLPLVDPKDLSENIDRVIVIDTNRRERLGKWEYLLDRARSIVVYDHHPGEEDLNADFSFIEEIGSTTTIILEEIRKSGISLTDFEATLFAIGIYEDTGCLTYDITDRRDVEAVCYLWEHGINTRLIQEYLRTPLSESQKSLFEKMLHSSRLHIINNRRVLISTTEFDEYVIGASSLLHLLDEIEDAGLTIVVIRMGDNIYLAARSRDDDLNLLELLEPFDVKGYPGAVSSHIKGRDSEKVTNEILAFLKKKTPPALTAACVASKPVFTIKSDLTIAAADELLAEHSFKGCPVIEDGRMAGIISRKDLRKGLRSGLGHAPVKGFMNRRIIAASPEQSLVELRTLLVDNNIGRVPITDGNGKLVGIVTRSDILRYMSYLDRRGRSLKNRGNDYYGDTNQLTADALYSSAGSINITQLITSELDRETNDLLMLVGQLGYREGLNVYLVGGIIRDLLLKYPPEQDLDFVIVGDAVDFAYKLQSEIGGTVRHFDRFRTASLVLENGMRLDLVTARRETYSSPAALPRVESAGLKEDLYRRDFTINAMACSLVKGNYGRLYDYYNGRYDLQRKLIRILYDQSFRDDPLRILRAIRFEQRYNFNIEENTLKLILQAIDRQVLTRVSRQRLNQELRLVYKEISPVRVLRRFDQLNLMPLLYPGITLDQHIWPILSKIEDIFNWADELKWRKKPDRELVYLAGLFSRLEFDRRSDIIKKLSLSEEKGKVLLESLEEVPVIQKRLNWQDLNPSQVVTFLETLTSETLILNIALTEEPMVLDYLEKYITRWRSIKPHIAGGELKGMGIKPGPLYRRLIKRLQQAVLDGEVKGVEEEREYVRKYIADYERREDS